MAFTTDYGHGIHAIDSGYGRPLLDAVHLLIEGESAALIDTATNSGVPRVLAALTEQGIEPEQVAYVILTHIHLDHAGAAGTLMAHLPQAKLVVHPRGAKHMVAPGKLLEAVATVYGADETTRMYGEILPVPGSRLLEAKHGDLIDLAGRKLQLLDTLGHARHHICIRDERTGHIFTGDTFGLSYRELDHNQRCFIFPSTSPSQFDPEALCQSIDLLMSFHPEACYLTHFGQVTDTPRLANDLKRLVNAHTQLGLHHRHEGEKRHEKLRTGIIEMVQKEAEQQHWGLQGEKLLELLAMDIELNAQGLGCWLDGRQA